MWPVKPFLRHGRARECYWMLYISRCQSLLYHVKQSLSKRGLGDDSYIQCKLMRNNKFTRGIGLKLTACGLIIFNPSLRHSHVRECHRMLYISRCQSLLYYVKQSSSKRGFCSFPLHLELRISTLPNCLRIWFSYGLLRTLWHSSFFTQVIL